jgi:hypothetical protein
MIRIKFELGFVSVVAVVLEVAVVVTISEVVVLEVAVLVTVSVVAVIDEVVVLEVAVVVTVVADRTKTFAPECAFLSVTRIASFSAYRTSSESESKSLNDIIGSSISDTHRLYQYAAYVAELIDDLRMVRDPGP